MKSLEVQISGVDAAPKIGKCDMFPSNNIWNAPIDQLPVHSNSDNIINGVNSRCTYSGVTESCKLHPDFGSGLYEGALIGIPITIVSDPNQKFALVQALESPEESDNVPMPIPDNAPIEGNGAGDGHVVVVYEPTCTLYELYHSERPSGNNGWRAGSTAVHDLTSNNLRPDTWTSADAAGLPILPGLARYEEVAAGEINHALRFTMVQTSGLRYQWPARHEASSRTDPKLPVLGDRFRLKASFDIDGQGFGEQTKVILRALKKYGMILADHGSNWYINGAPNDGWDNDQLVRGLHSGKIRASDFEVVEVSSLMVNKDSGEAKAQAPTTPRPTRTPTPRAPTGVPVIASPTIRPSRRPTSTPTTKTPTTSSLRTSNGTPGTANAAGKSIRKSYGFVLALVCIAMAVEKL